MDKKAAKKCFRDAIKLREKMRAKFPYATKEADDRHKTAIELLQEIMFFLREEPTIQTQPQGYVQATPDLEQPSSDTEGRSDGPAMAKGRSQLDECSVVKNISTQETLDEERRHSFLDCISESVKDICSSWNRAIKGELNLPSATASESEH